MYQTIVVGTDLSESAAKAVEQAAALAAAAGAKLHVVCAFKPAMTASVAATSLEAMAYGGADMLLEAESLLAEEVAGRLKTIAQTLSDQGVAVAVHSVQGDPVDALIDVAEQEKADLLVVGNRGMGGVKRFVLGSVPNKISHHSPCSVLIAHTS
jgi:nucleotide-binding universal stress UspA family protein